MIYKDVSKRVGGGVHSPGILEYFTQPSSLRKAVVDDPVLELLIGVEETQVLEKEWFRQRAMKETLSLEQSNNPSEGNQASWRKPRSSRIQTKNAPSAILSLSISFRDIEF